MYSKNVAYMGFGTICGFRHPLRVLECPHKGKGVLLYTSKQYLHKVQDILSKVRLYRSSQIQVWVSMMA